MSFTVHPIGEINARDDGFFIQLAPAYRDCLLGLEGFGYVQVLWWFDGCDNGPSRAKRTETQPYTHGPALLGTFATRSPERPNPIALSAAAVTFVDAARGLLGLGWIDARDGSPVLDLKPYTPSADRVESPAVPDWCGHWPRSVEESGDFDWEAEFNF